MHHEEDKMVYRVSDSPGTMTKVHDRISHSVGKGAVLILRMSYSLKKRYRLTFIHLFAMLLFTNIAIRETYASFQEICQLPFPFMYIYTSIQPSSNFHPPTQPPCPILPSISQSSYSRLLPLYANSPTTP